MGTGPYESRIIFDPLHTYTEVMWTKIVKKTVLIICRPVNHTYV